MTTMPTAAAVYVKTRLRSYQKRIVDDVRWQNSVVVLPTGSGKTLIAAQIAKEVLTGNSGNQRRKVLVLVPTCLLVEQQAAAFIAETGAIIAQYMGGMATPSNNFEALVTTPEAFRVLSNTKSDRFGVELFGLVVFDEAHHVVKKHPYRKIARIISLLPANQQPRILGLTASLSYAIGEKKIQTSIEDICSELLIQKVATASWDELKAGGYNGNRGDVVIAAVSEDATSSVDLKCASTGFADNGKFKVHQGREQFFCEIRDRTAHPLTLCLVDTITAFEKDVFAVDPTFMSPMKSSGKSGRVSNWGVYAHKRAEKALKPKRGPPKEIVQKLRDLYSLLEHLYESARLIVSSKQHELELALRYIEMAYLPFREPKSMASPSSTASAKDLPTLSFQALHNLHKEWDIAKQSLIFGRFKALKSALLGQKDVYGSKFRGLVFVQQRISTHIIQHFIETNPDMKKHFSCGAVYATSTAATATYKVSPSQSKNLLQQFASGQINLLISTAVSEEGMDVPAANVVIRFDPIQTPVSLVQSRGRARQQDSTFVVLSDHSKKRSLDVMQKAEQQQAEMIRSENFDILNTNVIDRQRMANKSRARAAFQYLKKARTPALPAAAVLHTFALKMNAELSTDFRKHPSGEWQCSMSLMMPSRPVQRAVGVKAGKKMAKTDAASKLLSDLSELDNEQ